MTVISTSAFPELLASDVKDVVADCCVLVVALDEDADDVDVTFGLDKFLVPSIPQRSEHHMSFIRLSLNDHNVVSLDIGKFEAP